MTSSELYALCEDADKAWPRVGDPPLISPSMPNEVAQFRVMLEVAYQLAVMNENLDLVINTRDARLRVMVEPGDWPIQVRNAQSR